MNIKFFSKQKLIATITLLALSIFFMPLAIKTDNIYHLSLIWSVVFIVPLFLSFELRYTIISAVILCIFFPILIPIFKSNFELNFFHTLEILLWIFGISFSEKLFTVKKYYKYSILLFIILICSILYLIIGKNLLTSENISGKNIILSPSFRRIFFVNESLSLLFFTIGGILLLELPVLRSFLGLNELQCSKNNVYIFLLAFIFTLLFVICDSLIDGIYLRSYGIRSSFVRSMNGQNIKFPILLIIVVSITKYILYSRRIREVNFQAIRQNESRLQSILSNMSDIFIETDKHGIIVDISNSIEKLFSGKSIDYIGVNITRLISDYQTIEQKIQTVNQEVRNFRTVIAEKNTQFYVLVDALTVPDKQNNVYKHILFIRDITELHNDQIKINDLNKQLESLILQRTDELSKAYSDMESFSYTVSHELKTPIREIDTYTEFIEEDNKFTLQESSKNDLKNIHEICTKTINLVQSMMEYSKVGYQIMNQEFVDVSQIVTESFDDIMLSNKERFIDLKISSLPKIYGDKFLLKQVIFNIISNSVKFTKKTKNARITVAAQEKNNMQYFYFTDNGAGFEENTTLQLFGLFNRMHNENEYEGNGIGLATVHKIMDRFHGTAEIHGKLNEGCCVTLGFPKNVGIK